MCALPIHFLSALLLQQLTEIAGSVDAGGQVACHGVAHAKRPLVGEQLGAECLAVERTGHDLERARAAIADLIQEAVLEREEAHEVARCHGSRDLLVVYGPFGRVAIGTVFGERVGEVSARDKDCLAAQLFDAFVDELAKLVVLDAVESRKTDAHRTVVGVELVDKPQRDVRCMVERGIALASRSRRKPLILGFCAERGYKLGVVIHRERGVVCAELREVARRARAGGDVEPVAVGGRMGRGYDDELGLERGDAACNLVVGVDGLLDLRLAPVADGGDDERRMRNDKRGFDTHG